ncbi:MAG: hypothetical protein NTX13_03610 [Acidobacteria bacterium]|nr:hypothetical protein [Acidobacteriota bacterium]
MTSLLNQPAAKLITARPGSLTPLPPAAVPGVPTGFLRPYANERLNSRLSQPLPLGSWTPSWDVPIDPSIKPSGLLAYGASVLALGLSAYQLFVAKKGLVNQPTTGRDAELIPSANVFLIPDRYGRIAAFDLISAAPSETLSPAGGMETKRTYFHRRPDGVTIVASLDASASPHNPAPTIVTYLQVFNAAGQATASRDALNAPLYIAMHENFLVLARRGAVDFIDLSLNVQRRLEADMTPQGLSLDESGRCYLLCAAPNRQQLWIVSHTGEYSATPLPDGVTVFQRPPVVGYDHRIYLLALDRILCLAANGQIEWQYQAPGRVAGATVSPNGLLLAAIGDAVVVLNPGGEARTLCRVAGEQLMGSPILGSTGELYALSGRRLHCFVSG